MSQSVLITGIEGFVGSQLARHLNEQGYRVDGIHLVAPVADLGFARLHHCDVRDADAVRSVLESAAPDFIVHLAGISSVRVVEQNPNLALQVNVVGTAHLLESLRVLGLRSRFLLVSSSEVYDRSAGGLVVLTESDRLRPMNFYALTKLLAEDTGRFYLDRHGIDIVILRSFSHTGPGQSLDFVFPSVARQIAEAESGKRPPAIEVGNTGVSRDYTDVRDICRAYELALTRTLKGEVYNVTSEHLLRVGEGIEYLASLARIPIEVRVASDRLRQENSVLAGSSAKFRAATGWASGIDIRQTLRDLLDYERGRLSDPSRR